jgi:hypothetical protein
VNKLHWIKEKDGTHKVMGLKPIRDKEDQEVSTSIWVKILKNKDFS